MTKVKPGRFTAQTDEPFVVFLLGFRVNRFFAFKKWIPVSKAMFPMVRNLSRRRRSNGFLGGYPFFYWRGLGMVQYWRSFDDLEKFARDKNGLHIDTWRQFNQTIGSDGSVGIWHETFLVESGHHEGVYTNMPVFGLAAGTRHVPAVGHRETARRRLGGENEPALPSTPTPVSVS